MVSSPTTMKKSFTKPKALKIKSAFKSAARLPAKVAGGGSSRNAFAPLAGENPIVVLKVQVLSCKELYAKDRNGYSDPYVHWVHEPVLQRLIIALL